MNQNIKACISPTLFSSLSLLCHTVTNKDKNTCPSQYACHRSALWYEVHVNELCHSMSAFLCMWSFDFSVLSVFSPAWAQVCSQEPQRSRRSSWPLIPPFSAADLGWVMVFLRAACRLQQLAVKKYSPIHHTETIMYKHTKIWPQTRLSSEGVAAPVVEYFRCWRSFKPIRVEFFLLYNSHKWSWICCSYSGIVWRDSWLWEPAFSSAVA